MDAALGWILSHGDELVNDVGNDRSGNSSAAIPLMSGGSGEQGNEEGNEGSASDEEGDDGDSFFIDDNEAASAAIAIATPPYFNPLASVSGSCDIQSDLNCTCQPAHGNFPSVGCRGYGVSCGKWYYEVTLKTAGCVQVGWADSAYKGSASAGQGVGDDVHSWAYDGWRCHIWHEVSADWGARWKPNDTVGCALDMDRRVMSFYLNGCGEEIGMGVAFEHFEYSGVLYPCLSFNNQEAVQFNLGNQGVFKYPPPVGYQPYSQHVDKRLSQVMLMMKQYVNHDGMKRFIAISPTTYTSTAVTVATGAAANTATAAFDKEGTLPLVFEDSLEEYSEEKELSATRRFFPQDGSKHSSSSSSSSESRMSHLIAPVAEFPSLAIPRGKQNRAKVMQQFIDLSKDLIILYSRSILFRLVVTLPQLNQALSSQFFAFLSSSTTATCVIANNGNNPVTASSASTVASTSTATTTHLDVLLALIRVNACTTNRARLYLHLAKTSQHSISFMPPSFNNLYCIGGAPFLHHITTGFKRLLSSVHNTSSASALEANDASNSSSASSNMIQTGTARFITTLLDQVLIDTSNSLQRAISNDWIYEGGIAPVLGGAPLTQQYDNHDQFIINSNVTDVTSSSATAAAVPPVTPTSPSLIMAVWLSFNLVDAFLLEFNPNGGSYSTCAAVDSQCEGSSSYNTAGANHVLNQHQVGEWLIQLCHHWSLALQSPNMFVKLCAMRVVSYILQEVHLNANVLRSYRIPLSVSKQICDCVPILRLRAYACQMIAVQRQSLPVVSEYLQVRVRVGANSEVV